jgi:hypothetical protein
MNFGACTTSAFASPATSGGFDADGPSRALLPVSERVSRAHTNERRTGVHLALGSHHPADRAAPRRVRLQPEVRLPARARSLTTTLVRWEPFRELGTLQSEMSRLMIGMLEGNGRNAICGCVGAGSSRRRPRRRRTIEHDVGAQADYRVVSLPKSSSTRRCASSGETSSSF